MAECGTNRGYDVHRENGTTICGPCRQAHSTYMAQWARLHPDRARRQQAKLRAAWAWVRQNRPDVAAEIRSEAGG